MLRTFLDKFFRSIQRYWQLYVLFVIGLFVLMRFHWAFRVIAAVVFVLAILVALLGAVIAVADLISGSGSEPQFLKRLADRAETARLRISELREESRGIETKVRELDALAQNEQLPSGKQWGKSMLLLEGYRAELSLRQAKIDFYTRSLHTLTNLAEKWRQERRLNELQSGLEKLKSPTSAEEQLQMRSLKAELAQEEDLLKSYKELSKRLDKSDSLENAQSLRKELERLLN